MDNFIIAEPDFQEIGIQKTKCDQCGADGTINLASISLINKNEPVRMFCIKCIQGKEIKNIHFLCKIIGRIKPDWYQEKEVLERILATPLDDPGDKIMAAAATIISCLSLEMNKSDDNNNVFIGSMLHGISEAIIIMAKEMEIDKKVVIHRMFLAFGEIGTAYKKLITS